MSRGPPARRLARTAGAASGSRPTRPTSSRLDIPRQPLIRKFRVHVGHCEACGKRTQGRHPLQTSDALGAAASQIGPDAQAAAAVLHTQMGLSHGKVASVFQALFGIKLTRGASAQIGLRAAISPGAGLPPDPQRACGRRSGSRPTRRAGGSAGGRPAWLHVWVADRATAYGVDSKRKRPTPWKERVIGRDWAGILCHDGFASYDRFEGAIHQQCVGPRAPPHPRPAGTLAHARGRPVPAAGDRAVHRGDPTGRSNGYVSGTWTDNQLDAHRVSFDDRLLELVRRPRAVPEYATLAKHLWNHLEQWFAFVFNPRIEPTNWRAEQAIRPAVVNRKVWGGNRTAMGAQAQGVLMSVFETCRRQTLSVVDHVSRTLRWFGNRLLSRPLLFRQ